MENHNLLPDNWREVNQYDRERAEITAIKRKSALPYWRMMLCAIPVALSLYGPLLWSMRSIPQVIFEWILKRSPNEDLTFDGSAPLKEVRFTPRETVVEMDKEPLKPL